MKRLIKKIDHYVIYTDNVEKITDFYQKLGFDLATGDGVPALVGPQLIIKIHGPASEAKPVPKVISKGGIDICFESDFTTEEIIQYLKQQKISIHEGPVARCGFKGSIESVYILDPDGNLIELSSYRD